MGRITGLEKPEELPEKVKAIYDAVLQALNEGSDLSELTVSDITGRAGIGKGTAYDYFESKEEIIVCAVVCLMSQIMTGLRERLDALDGLERQIDFLLDWVERNFREQKCVYRFLHLLTDSAYIGQRIRQKALEEGTKENHPMALFKNLARTAMEKGEIADGFTPDYVAYAICARLVSLIAYLHIEQYGKEQLADMRRQIRQGLLGELCRRTASL